MDIFEYIEMFYNIKRRHGSNNQLSPVEYEKQYESKLKSVYWFGGYSKWTTKLSGKTPQEKQNRNLETQYRQLLEVLLKWLYAA